MPFVIVYWHWLVLGMILIIAEIFVPSFTILWFGLGAVVVALILLPFPDMSLAWQLVIWALSSCALIFLWFKFLKRVMPDRTKAGVAREAVLGESGIVTKAPADKIHGTVRFTTPILGSDEWPFISENPVAVGDRVTIVEISGNTLIVEKKNQV
ncbi:MAG TPA: NfeD family protein [Thermodesulfobacteriota bacterium]|nr:NfeD family protein [Thermodesulfobacteriota bacterium]